VASGGWPIGNKTIEETNMKAIMSIITISAAAALLNAPVLRAQETAPEPKGNAQAQDELAKAKAQAQDEEVKAQKTQAEAQANYAKAQQQFEHAQADMAKTGASAGGGGFGGNNFYPSSTPGYSQRLQSIVKRAPDHRAGRTVVIRSSESDPKEQAKLEEDLSVMSHILEKAVSEKAGGRGDGVWGGTAMGISVFGGPNASPLRSLYLEGYGVLFMLNVGFPVLPPPQGEEQQEKTETTSDWEEAKEELYGQGGVGYAMAGSSEPYDKERVNRLRDGLLEALKNATNLRDLKSDDSITVCVFGGPSSGQPKGRTYFKRSTGGSGGAGGLGGSRSEGRGEAGAFASAGGQTQQTMMTIRVKKSDADAFAKGSITQDAFRKRAHIVTYASSSDAGMSNSENWLMLGGGAGGGGGMSGGGFGGGGAVKR
jgi:hypothetical protein